MLTHTMKPNKLTEMGPALKFIKRLELDKTLFTTYIELRTLFQKHNFTQKELESVSYAPDEIMVAHMKIRNEFDIIKQNLHKYGFTDFQDMIPDEVSDYLTSTLKKIDEEISLDGNTGFYTQEKEERYGLFENTMSFKQIEDNIKSTINGEEMRFEDFTIYWDGEKDVEESCSGIINVEEVEIVKSDDECQWKVTVYLGQTKSTEVNYQDSDGDGYDAYSVKIFDINDVPYVHDEIESLLTHFIMRRFPFDEPCISIKFNTYHIY